MFMVLLAAQADLHALLPTPLPRLTPTTHTTRAALYRELRDARTRRYALNTGEFDPDLHGVAAPILNHNGETIAALSLEAPPARFTARKAGLIHATQDAARRASLAIGHVPELAGPASVGVHGRSKHPAGWHPPPPLTHTPRPRQAFNDACPLCATSWPSWSAWLES